jgi:hypothetical protein
LAQESERREGKVQSLGTAERLSVDDRIEGRIALVANIEANGVSPDALMFKASGCHQ